MIFADIVSVADSRVGDISVAMGPLKDLKISSLRFREFLAAILSLRFRDFRPVIISSLLVNGRSNCDGCVLTSTVGISIEMSIGSISSKELAVPTGRGDRITSCKQWP